MYYVYRYIYSSEIIYIGITNDLDVRNNQHKRDKWYHDKLKYEFIQLDNSFIAELYEKYLINRDNPKGNIKDKNNYNVADIQFNIVEIWKPVILKKNSHKENAKRCNKKDANKLEKVLARERELQETDDKFIKLINESKEEIIKVYYDEHEFLTVILKCPKFKEILNLKYMPSCVTGIVYNQNSNIVVIHFNKYENLNKKYKDEYNKIYELLDINKLDLDKNYGKQILNSEMNNIEKKYMTYIDNKYEITLIRIKDNFPISIPITKLLELFGGLEFVYRLPFALGLKYKSNRDILLIHYEPIKYNEIFNYELKEKFKFQYYFKITKEEDLLEYLLYKKQILNRMLSGYEEYDEEFGFFNQTRESVLKVDISKSIVRDELSRYSKEYKELNNEFDELDGIIN